MISLWLLLSIAMLLTAFCGTLSSHGSGSQVSAWSRAMSALPILVYGIPVLAYCIQVGFFDSNGSLSLLLELSPLLVLAGFSIVSVSRGSGFRGPAAIMILVSAVAALVGHFGGFGVGQALIAAIIAAGLGLMPATEHGLHSLTTGTRQALILVLLGLGSLTLFHADIFVDACRSDKCSILTNESLRLGNSGNSVGLLLLGMMPFALWGLPVRRLLLASGGILVALDLAGSRSALIGAAFCAAALMLERTYRSKSKRVWGRLSLVPLGAAFVLSVIPAVRYEDPTAYTYRGELWTAARRLIQESPVYGNGPAFWSSQIDTSSALFNYGPHNLWLEIGVSLGMVGVLLCLLSMAAFVYGVHSSARGLFVAFLSSVFAGGILEATYVPYRPAVLFGALPVYLALLFYSQTTSRRPPLQSLAASRIDSDEANSDGTGSSRASGRPIDGLSNERPAASRASRRQR